MEKKLIESIENINSLLEMGELLFNNDTDQIDIGLTEYEKNKYKKRIEKMNKLICTVGLPRSGKTTWIKKNDIKAPIVSPDAIRLALHGQQYIPEAEDMVWAMAKIMVRSLFKAGHGIVFVDATNNTKKRRDFWQSIMDKEWITFFKVFNTSAQECIERAKKMDDLIILPVIERMAAQFEPLDSYEKIFGECIQQNQGDPVG